MPNDHPCDLRAHERIDVLEVKFVKLEKAIVENTNLTQTIADNTGELVELVKGIKGFRSLVVWAAPIVAAGIALVAYLKGH